MSIYIEGLNLPKKGEGYLIAINSDGEVCDWRSYELTGCKAIGLPPHGRLGDLDALERNLREMAGYQHGDRQQGILGCCSTICSADTIIPADGGADNG